MGTPENRKLVVIGGGPAGLTAALELTRLGFQPVVVEKSDVVGGLARTEVHRGYRFDMGGHRFFTKSTQVQRIWHEILSDELIVRSRLSRIYYRGKFFAYPIQLWNALSGLGLMESFRVLASYVRWKLRPYPTEETFEQWVTNRFGKRLFEIFFESYTEKVWGIPCTELSSEWAAQRIRDLTLRTAIVQAIVARKKNVVRTLIAQFEYPRLGPGMLWNRVAQIVEERSGHVRRGCEVLAIERHENVIERVVVQTPAGEKEFIEGDEFMSSMPVSELIRKLDPPPEAEILEAAAKLSHRDFLTVCLIINCEQLFPDNWIYIHEPCVRVARIQNFKNWSPDMVPDSSRTSLGLEYFCQKDDEFWNSSDEDLIELAKDELERIGLVNRADVESGCVYRMENAYPVYDSTYTEHLRRIREYIDALKNLQTIGRNGLHRYNNQDHAMLTGLFAARNAAFGENHDLWNVNEDASYHEELHADDKDYDAELESRTARSSRGPDHTHGTVVVGETASRPDTGAASV